MQAYIRRDTKRGPRHGLIIISDVHTLPHPLLVTLQRFSDGKFFSAHGLWQSKREQLRAEVRNWENGTLSIGIGPEILSELDGRTKYRMNLGSGPSFPLALSRDLVHSLAECHMPVREERRAEHSQGVTLRPLIAAGIAGLMVCGAAFLYMQDSRQRVMEASASITYSDDINADVPDTALYTTVAGDADGGNAARMERISSAMFDQSPSLSPGASMKTLDLSRGHEVPSPFHKILKREMTGEALSEARREELDNVSRVLNISIEDMDSALRMLHEAAESGNTEAMFMLAQYYDPLSDHFFDSGCNPILAGEWYKRAEACGLAGAGIAAEALRQYLLNLAEEGSEEALAVLRLW